MNFFKKIEKGILKFEYAAVISILMMMCILAFAQVVLRNVFSFSFIWADILVRLAVLWVAILGASIATSEKGHIHIDLFSRVLSKNTYEYLEAFLSLVASVVCFLFFLVAMQFVGIEKEVGNVIHELHAPEWIFTTIFPMGFLFMSFKFLLCFFSDLADVRKGDTEEVEAE